MRGSFREMMDVTVFFTTSIQNFLVPVSRVEIFDLEK